MRRFLLLIFLIVLSFITTACRNSSPDQSANITVKPTTTATTEPTTTPTATTTPEPTAEFQGIQIEESYDVIIIGAGISGLSAAYFLRDYNIKLLEKNDYTGGRTSSGTYKGFSYATGTEYLGEPYGALATIIDDLGLNLKEIPAPMDAQFRDKKFYYGEDGLASMLTKYSSRQELNRFISTIQAYGTEYDDIPDFDLNSDLAALDDITAREWFDQQKFPEIFYKTYNISARGLFGANLDEISALSFIPEIAFDYEGVGQNSTSQQSNSTGAYTFETGISDVTNAITKELGDAIQLNSTVVSIDKQGNSYLVTYTDAYENLHHKTADVVILAVPAPIAVIIAGESTLSQEQISIMEQIPYSTYATVALFSDEPIFNKAFDLAVTDQFFFTDIYDSTWIQRYYDQSLADNPASIMGVYIAPDGYMDRTLFVSSEDDIIEEVYQGIDKLFPGSRDKITGYDLRRFPYAYPVMTTGAYKRLSRLNKITQGNLLLAGDYMIYPTFEAAAQSGSIAAQKAIDELER